MRSLSINEIEQVTGGDGNCISGADVLTLAGYSVLLGLSSFMGPLGVAGAALAFFDKASEIIDKEDMCKP